jgi:outer membrane protein assembly factor BamB
MEKRNLVMPFNIGLLFISIIIFNGCNSRCDDLVFPDKVSSPYILPYPPGKTYSLFQGYCKPSGHRNRLAYDFKMPIGAEITNSRPGVVIEIQDDYSDDDNKAGHNNRVLIQHEDGSIAWYAHLKQGSIHLSVGDTLEYGDLIGLCGTSGRSGNVPHLHFEVFNKFKYEYDDAVPISFNNIKGKLDERGGLIQDEYYTSLKINTPKWDVPSGEPDHGDTGWHSPLIDPEGTIYFGAKNGIMWAVNPDGTVKWEKKIAENLAGSSAVLAPGGKAFYIGEQAHPGRLLCVNCANGTVIWEFKLPPPDHLQSTPEPDQKLGGGINSTPSISHDGKTIYFGTGNWVECNPCEEDIYDDRIFALDVSGDHPKIKWILKGSVVDKIQNKFRLSVWPAPSIAPDGTIYVSNFNGFLYHIKDHGNRFEILHRFNFHTIRSEKAIRELIPPEIWSSCAISADGTVFISSNDGQMWAFNPDLSVKWNYKYQYDGQFYEAFASPVLTPNGLVIMGNEKGYLNGHEMESGKLVWQYPGTENPPEEWWRTPSVTADGTLIVGSEKSGKYFAVNSQDGKLVWQTPNIGMETGCFPAIADDGTIYVTGGFNGGLFALPGNSPLANTDWPKGLQNNCNNSRFGESGSSPDTNVFLRKTIRDEILQDFRSGK